MRHACVDAKGAARRIGDLIARRSRGTMSLGGSFPMQAVPSRARRRLGIVFYVASALVE